MAGLDKAKAAEVLGLPANLELVVSLTVGKIAPADLLPEPLFEREVAPRVRKDLDEIVLHGKP